MALHKLHIVLKARGLTAAPQTASEVERWLTRLVRAVRMQVLMPARAVRCDDPGNEGVTGTVVIKTSHASIHVWDRCADPHLEFDLFSCSPFGSGEIVRLVEEFGPTPGPDREPAVSWTVFDRNGPRAEIVEMGEFEGYPRVARAGGADALAPSAGFVS